MEEVGRLFRESGRLHCAREHWVERGIKFAMRGTKSDRPATGPADSSTQGTKLSNGADSAIAVVLVTIDDRPTDWSALTQSQAPTTGRQPGPGHVPGRTGRSDIRRNNGCVTARPGRRGGYNRIEDSNVLLPSFLGQSNLYLVVRVNLCAHHRTPTARHALFETTRSAPVSGCAQPTLHPGTWLYSLLGGCWISRGWLWAMLMSTLVQIRSYCTK
jgi:hypothetical protein